MNELQIFSSPRSARSEPPSMAANRCLWRPMCAQCSAIKITAAYRQDLTMMKRVCRKSTPPENPDDDQ